MRYVGGKSKLAGRILDTILSTTPRRSGVGMIFWLIWSLTRLDVCASSMVGSMHPRPTISSSR